MSFRETMRWYEDEFSERFGDDPLSRAALYLSIASWMAPVIAIGFLLSDLLEELLTDLVGEITERTP